MPRDEIKKIIEDCEKSTKIDKDIYDGLFKESLVVHL